MRLRRLELAVIGVTLAFACFIGGYMIGRSRSAVSITPAVIHQHERPAVGEVAQHVVPALPAIQEYEPTQVQGQTANQQNTANDAGITPAPPVSSRDKYGRININTASRAELMDLPGIGSTLSERIVEYRRVNGFFSSIEELRNVSGIGERRFETIMDRITVG